MTPGTFHTSTAPERDNGTDLHLAPRSFMLVINWELWVIYILFLHFVQGQFLAQVKESFRWRFILSESGGADEVGLLIPRDTNALRLHPRSLLTFTGTPVLVSGFKETSEFHGNSLRKEWMKDTSQ